MTNFKRLKEEIDFLREEERKLRERVKEVLEENNKLKELKEVKDWETMNEQK